MANYEKPMELTAAVQLKKALSPFLKDTFFTNQKTNSTGFVAYEKVTSSDGIARLIGKGDPAYNIKKGTRSAVSFQLPTSKEKITFTTKEYEDYKLLGAGVIESGSTNPTVSAFDEFMLNNVDELKRRALRLQELMCAQALNAGKIDMIIDGKQFTVDFGFTSGATGQIRTALTGDALWSASTSDPLKNIRQWSTQISKGTGYSADILILGETVAESFVSNTSIKAALDNLNYKAGSLSAMAGANSMFGGNYIMTLPNGIEVWSYIQEYTDASGSTQQMITKTNAILTSRAAAKDIFEFHKGTISRYAQGTANGMQRAVEFYADVMTNEDGSAKTFQLEHTSLPIIKIPEGIVICKVV